MAPSLLVIAASITACVVVTHYQIKNATAPAEVVSLAAAGRDYPRELASVYATAWRNGADALESGRSVDDSLGVVAQDWQTGRTTLFQTVLTPAFHAVVPEGTADDQVTRADKAALAKLFRQFADGLDASPR